MPVGIFVPSHPHLPPSSKIFRLLSHLCNSAEYKISNNYASYGIPKDCQRRALFGDPRGNKEGKEQTQPSKHTPVGVKSSKHRPESILADGSR